jgi:type IV secretory pathway TraG/TraD family ATPase VirD4
MIPERFAWPVGGFLSGVALSGIAVLVGFPFSRIAWAMPLLGLAIGLLWVRASITGEAGRMVTGAIAAACLIVSSTAGFAALMSVAAGAWQRRSGTDIASLVSFTEYIAAAWENAWLAIILWALLAIVPLLAGLVIIRPYLVRLFAGSRDVEGGPWSARWMQPPDIRYLARQATGLPLGRVNGKILRYAPGDGWRGGHHMLIAGTRAGKGVSGVLPAIIDHDGPVVALDIKGELFAVTRRAREEQGRRVVVLNPLDVVEPGRACFNPLDYVRNDPAHIGRDAEVIADGLIKPEAGGTDHFTDMARNLLAAAVEVVVKVAKPEDRNFTTLADMLGPGVEATLEAWSNSPDVVGKSPAHTAASVLAAGDKERGSIITTVSKALHWTLSDPMQHFLQRSDFDLEKLMDGDTDRIHPVRAALRG